MCCFQEGTWLWSSKFEGGYGGSFFQSSRRKICPSTCASNPDLTPAQGTVSILGIWCSSAELQPGEALPAIYDPQVLQDPEARGPKALGVLDSKAQFKQLKGKNISNLDSFMRLVFDCFARAKTNPLLLFGDVGCCSGYSNALGSFASLYI